MKQISSFSAHSIDGEEYKIGVYVDLLDIETHDDSDSFIEGKVKKLRTLDGSHVQRLGKGKYMLSNTSLKLFSDSPDAP